MTSYKTIFPLPRRSSAGIVSLSLRQRNATPAEYQWRSRRLLNLPHGPLEPDKIGLQRLKGINVMSQLLLHRISKNVWFILARLAQEQGTISYSDLKEKTGLSEYYLGLVIRSIALLCFKQGMPILSSVIDNPTTEKYLIRDHWSHRKSALDEVFQFDWKIVSNPYSFIGSPISDY